MNKNVHVHMYNIWVVSRICYWPFTVVRVATSLHKVAREVSLNKIADVAIHTCSKRIAKACACSNTRATRGAD